MRKLVLVTAVTAASLIGASSPALAGWEDWYMGTDPDNYCTSGMGGGDRQDRLQQVRSTDYLTGREPRPGSAPGGVSSLSVAPPTKQSPTNHPPAVPRSP